MSALWRPMATQVTDEKLGLGAREVALLTDARAEADMLATLVDALRDQSRTVQGAQGHLVARAPDEGSWFSHPGRWPTCNDAGLEACTWRILCSPTRLVAFVT